MEIIKKRRRSIGAGNSYSRYLKFTSTGNNTLSLNNVGGNAPTLYYSTNGVTWDDWDYSEISLSSGSSVYINGDNPGGFSSSDTIYSTFVMNGDGVFLCSGDVTSLLDRNDEVSAITKSYCFSELFSGCNRLRTSPELPSVSISDYCYRKMFYNCYGMSGIPELPATKLGASCYYMMFYSCSNMITAPDLPATELAYACYQYMFYHCHYLENPPAILPASALTTACYDHMFSCCWSLKTTPQLPATSLTPSCYWSMFWQCSGLTSAPALPATSLALNCYRSMFSECKSLTDMPLLPTTNLAQSCYMWMFEYCTSLTGVTSKLPATTIPNSAYTGMFYACTALETPPDLPATNVGNYGYQVMFSGCTSLTGTPIISATTLGQYSCERMFGGSGIINPPVLPATTMKAYCYQGMFTDCTGLTSAPELPHYPAVSAITTSATRCFAEMFKGCTSLVESPYMAYDSSYFPSGIFAGMFSGCTSLSAITFFNFMNGGQAIPTACTENWVAGVANFGYFTKYYQNTWTRDANGIPVNWNPVDDELYTPLTFSINGSGRIYWRLNTSGSYSPVTISYVVNNGSTKTITAAGGTSYITVYSGDTLTIWGTNPSYAGNYFDSNTPFTAYGNIMSLISGANPRIFSQNKTLDSQSAFYRLFMNCQKLLLSNETGKRLLLPATALTSNCYMQMFSNCSGITVAPELPATTLPNSCYAYMFSGCTSLTSTPELLATSLATLSYAGMFAGCTSLVNGPSILPAQTLGSACYRSMFNGCTNLSAPPELPASALTTYCYETMFEGCQSITGSPILPATTLVESCYARMFYGCTGLCYITCYATDTAATQCTQSWVYNVADSGTFVKSTGMTSWTRGVNGIPYNWIVDGEVPYTTGITAYAVSYDKSTTLPAYGGSFSSGDVAFEVYENLSTGGSNLLSPLVYSYYAETETISANDLGTTVTNSQTYLGYIRYRFTYNEFTDVIDVHVYQAANRAYVSSTWEDFVSSAETTETYYDDSLSLSETSLSFASGGGSSNITAVGTRVTSTWGQLEEVMTPYSSVTYSSLSTGVITGETYTAYTYYPATTAQTYIPVTSTVVSSNSWISVSPSNGNTPLTTTITVSENNSNATRSGYVRYYIGNGNYSAVTFTQEASTASHTYELVVSPESYTFSSASSIGTTYNGWSYTLYEDGNIYGDFNPGYITWVTNSNSYLSMSYDGTAEKLATPSYSQGYTYISTMATYNDGNIYVTSSLILIYADAEEMPVSLTGISVSYNGNSLLIPASGGSVSSANISTSNISVTLSYSNGVSTAYPYNSFTGMGGSISFGSSVTASSLTTATTSSETYVGSLSITASYGGYSDSTNVSVYQDVNSETESVATISTGVSHYSKNGTPIYNISVNPTAQTVSSAAGTTMINVYSRYAPTTANCEATSYGMLPYTAWTSGSRVCGSTYFDIDYTTESVTSTTTGATAATGFSSDENDALILSVSNNASQQRSTIYYAGNNGSERSATITYYNDGTSVDFTLTQQAAYTPPTPTIRTIEIDIPQPWVASFASNPPQNNIRVLGELSCLGESITGETEEQGIPSSGDYDIYFDDFMAITGITTGATAITLTFTIDSTDYTRDIYVTPESNGYGLYGQKTISGVGASWTATINIPAGDNSPYQISIDSITWDMSF